MNKFEKISSGEIYSKKIEDVALQFAEMPKFQELIKDAKDKIEATKNVRMLLSNQFSDIIAELPEPLPPSEEAPGTRVSNEFMVAKNIVDLLYKK